MQIREFTGADFEPLSRIVGDLWHAQHEGRAYWHGADELCVHLSHTNKGLVAEENGEVVGTILLESPRDEDNNKDLHMHWLQQRTRIAAMCNALGFNVREDNEVLNVEREAISLAADRYGSDGVGEIVLLIVAKNAQGQGIGRALLREGLSWLADHDASVIRLVTDNQCDWQLYEHLDMKRLSVGKRLAVGPIESFVYQGDAADLIALLESTSSHRAHPEGLSQADAQIVTSDAAHTAAVENMLAHHAQDMGMPMTQYAYHIEKDGRLVAGITAWSMGPDVHIDTLVVDEPEREKGLGGMLLERVEQEARQNGCTTASVDTFSFQAPQYYPARGYKVVFRYMLDDGTERVYFSKRL